MCYCEYIVTLMKKMIKNKGNIQRKPFKKQRFEHELFEPVKRLLTRQGFQVQGEVKSLDVLAVKDQETIAVELKLMINLKLIYQAVDRLNIADAVYVAIPYHALRQHKQTRYFIGLLKRLEIGLISIQGDKAIVLLEAKPFNQVASRQRHLKRKASLLKEFFGRGDSDQKGGIQGQRITAYRLRAMTIKDAMVLNTMYTPKDLKARTQVHDTYSILRNNYYGWFKKVKRGHYSLVQANK